MSTADRFTRDGSEALERHLARVCSRVRSGVEALVPDRKLEALVLGGGYGRGEGGVLKTAAGDAPYNDLEFYVFLRGNRVWNERNYRAPLLELGERLSPKAGLHVEFKVDSLDRLRRAAPSLFTYDLVWGHRIIVGPGTLFDGCKHHRDSRRIPLHEATRLLLNRCTGLLLAQELLRHDRLTSDQSDFVGRNLAKAQLAFGDAVLVAMGRYHWSCLERHERLQHLLVDGRLTGSSAHVVANGSPLAKAEFIADVMRHHAAGVEFKLHPRRVVKNRTEFEREHRALSELGRTVWLWLESRRLHCEFPTVREYAFSRVVKTPDHVRWRSLLLNLKTFGVRSLGDRMAFRYPRERLLNALPLLLWEQPLNEANSRRHLQYHLHTEARDWQSLVAVYKGIWPAFS